MTAVAKLRNSEPGALEKLLRGDLDWIVMKALEKDRSRRYASASARPCARRPFSSAVAIAV